MQNNIQDAPIETILQTKWMKIKVTFEAICIKINNDETSLKEIQI